MHFECILQAKKTHFKVIYGVYRDYIGSSYGFDKIL